MTKNVAQTKKLAAEITKDLLADKIANRAKIMALTGELGSGKTTFIQGMAKGLGIKDRITSPTFVIMKRLQITKRKSPVSNFYHIDCYRIENIKELSVFNFQDIIGSPKNLVVIEWAEKIKALLPQNVVWLKFEWVGEKKRRIIIQKL